MCVCSVLAGPRSYPTVLTSITVFYDTIITVSVKPITALLTDLDQALSQTFIIPRSVLRLLRGSVGRVKEMLVELQMSS